MTISQSFRNIRYARAERFASAELLPFEDAVLSEERGPLAPQNPSRFELLLGPQAELRQSEDCQVLSVFTPNRSGSRPVMVWFHGGASITGGGELPWYDGDRLAVQLDMVIVTVTARLGALGYLALDPEERPSPATTDHLAALKWINLNIAEFGGDPNDVTLFGQSAGAYAIEVLLRWGSPVPLRGVILQSGFLSQESIRFDAETAHVRSSEFASFAGDDLNDMPIEKMLLCQAEFSRHLGVVELWAPVRPSKEEPIAVPVLAGATRDDALPFVLGALGISSPSQDDVDSSAHELAVVNMRDVHQGNIAVLTEAAVRGFPAFAYEIQWEATQPPWRASHCIELPYLFGTDDAWSAAPIIQGASRETIQAWGAWLREAWGGFARHHSPGFKWERFDPVKPCVNVISAEHGSPVLRVEELRDVWPSSRFASSASVR